MGSDADPMESPKLTRPANEQLDAILGLPYSVLDHGFVRVVDYMGSDVAVVQAARVSYGSGTRQASDDTALIRYLLRHSHTTPFEMCEIKLHVKMPIFVARQWIRHRTASVNEYSGRYSIIDNESYVPSLEAIAMQNTSNRQGRGEVLSPDISKRVQSIIREDARRAYATYEQLLGNESDDGSEGVARELARIGLGVNFYTQWYWKINLHNLLHFLRLRVDPHAQYEIRQYAKVILDILKLWVPITYQAFLDYGINSATLSAGALAVLKALLAGSKVDFASSGLTRREWQELNSMFHFDEASSL
jgi:thymidylate synthase (FAD)